MLLVIFLQKDMYYFEKARIFSTFAKECGISKPVFLQLINLTVKLIQSKTVLNPNPNFSLVLLEAELKFMDSRALL